MQALGVGLVYWPALELLVRAAGSTIAVVELEPQALWEKTSDAAGWHYRGNETLLGRVAALPQAKLLHGGGHQISMTFGTPWANRLRSRQA